MTGDDTHRIHVAAQNLGCSLYTILITDAMEAVATNALLKPRVRAGVDNVWERHLPVEGSIEYRNLGDRWQDALNGFDALQIGRIMLWSNFGQASDGILDPRRHQRTLLIFLPSVNDTMTHHINI